MKKLLLITQRIACENRIFRVSIGKEELVQKQRFHTMDDTECYKRRCIPQSEASCIITDRLVLQVLSYAFLCRTPSNECHLFDYTYTYVYIHVSILETVYILIISTYCSIPLKKIGRPKHVDVQPRRCFVFFFKMVNFSVFIFTEISKIL